MAGPAMGPVHLLHIRKTGGTALKHALQQAIDDNFWKPEYRSYRRTSI